MEGIYSLLRKIIRNQKRIIKEQKKQTKILQAVETSLEKETIIHLTNPYKVNELVNQTKDYRGIN